MIKRQYPIEPKESAVEEVSLTHQETNVLRYSAGYIPRALPRSLRSQHTPSVRNYLSVC